MKPWLNKLLIEGRIVPDTIIRNFRYKEFKEEREKNIKMRYNKKEIKKSGLLKNLGKFFLNIFRPKNKKEIEV